MKLNFGNLEFSVEDNKISLVRFGGFYSVGAGGFAEVHVSGEDKPSHMGAKLSASSEGERLTYVSHRVDGNVLTVAQRSNLIELTTIFTSFEGTNAISVRNEIKNISDGEIVIEEASSFSACILGEYTPESVSDISFTEFTQSHHKECQPVTRTLRENGLFGLSPDGQRVIRQANIGSWSTKEALGQGIVSRRGGREFLMFQIESNNSWYYEIGDKRGGIYLYLGGANLLFGGWSKQLASGEVYVTPTVALALGDSLDGVIGEMTAYRRRIVPDVLPDRLLPAIFNEYMHLSWDSPTEEQTARVADVVKDTGVKYYVIDCGWHNEEPGNEIYPYVGQWMESKARFPGGLRKTTDLIRSLGMKAGLWIEPEIIGIKCEDMIKYYPEEAFLQRNGRKISVMGRYFLDFRHEAVIGYLSETIRRMVEDYGADYIKLDYNQDCGVGTDYASFCMGEGLESCARAYLEWIDEMRKAFPEVLFETCSSGGMRMDYQTLSHFSIVSTSDQTDYLKYPYIAGNILCAVLPEQAAVWSYPIGLAAPGEPMTKSREWIEKNVSDERIAMNMINSFLGRMHLASHLELMNDHQLSLVREGVEYYDSLTEAKKRAKPCFPLGFTGFGKENVAAGLVDGNRVYLAVWHLSGENEVTVPLGGIIKDARISYPKSSNAQLVKRENELTVKFTSCPESVFVEVEM